MDQKHPRKFNSITRKKLISKIDILKNNDDYIQIYYIIVNDIGNNISSNRNGLFININLLSDKCIQQLMHFVEKKLNVLILDDNIEHNDYHNIINNIKINNNSQPNYNVLS